MAHSYRKKERASTPNDDEGDKPKKLPKEDEKVGELTRQRKKNITRCGKLGFQITRMFTVVKFYSAEMNFIGNCYGKYTLKYDKKKRCNDFFFN